MKIQDVHSATWNFIGDQIRPSDAITVKQNGGCVYVVGLLHARNTHVLNVKKQPTRRKSVMMNSRQT